MKEIVMAGPFGSTSTTDDVLSGEDLSGKRVLVTGVSAGLGVETARALAVHGAQVVGAARDLAKAKRATAEVRAQAANGGGLELVELDLASLKNVRACADALVADGRLFDVVIANAGVMRTPFGHTADDLVNRIASLIAPGGRLVNVSSSGHRYSEVDLVDPNFERTPYEPTVAYGRSKTANILFAVEFDRRHRARGVRATALHPGGILTELGRHLQPASSKRPLSGSTPSWRPKAGRPSSSRRSPREPRPRCGLLSSPRPKGSAGATARTAKCRS
jgi:NAD(P)-dependent dehydrogenase (short-subunit alcohol dehydrogenase family)